LLPMIMASDRSLQILPFTNFKEVSLTWTSWITLVLEENNFLITIMELLGDINYLILENL